MELIRTQVMTAFDTNMRFLLTAEAAANAASGHMTLPTRPLSLVRKAFVKRNELSVLLNKMRLDEGDRVFFDDKSLLPPEHNSGSANSQVPKSRRHHKSDGFIFQPNVRYVFSKHYDLLKWKWPELRSVDLQVNIPMEAGGGGYGHGGNNSGSSGGGGGGTAANEWPVYLMCAGPDGIQINCTKRGDVNVGLGELIYTILLCY